jgi:ketosteroid isomerase-like protein
MSQDNVDVIRRLLEAFAEGDVGAVFAASDPDIELEVSDAYFDAPRTFHGHDGMREIFAAQAEVFSPFRLEPKEFVDAGDRVVVMARAGGLARASGVDVMGSFGHLWTLRDGKVVRFKEFKDPREALEAAGLQE